MSPWPPRRRRGSENPPPRRRSRGWFAVALAIVLSALPGSLAQDLTPARVLVPPEGDYGSLFRRVEEFARRERWDMVLEGLSKSFDLWAKPEAGGVVSSGGGLSVGAAKLFADLAERLPDPYALRYRERLDAVLRRGWNDVCSRLDEAARSPIRRRLLRDFPRSGLRRELLLEEITTSFESGAWESCRAASDVFLGALPPTAPGDSSDAAKELLRLRVSVRVLLITIAAARAERAELDAQLTALRELRSDPLYTEFTESFRKRIDSAIDGALPTLESEALRRPPLVADGLRPRIVDVRTTPPAPFRLGSVQFHEAVADSRLRPLVRELSSRAVTDVPHPYHATGDGRRVVFQHADRVTSVDAETYAVEWTVGLTPEPRGFAGTRVVSLGPELCFVATGAVVSAFRSTDGSHRWSSRIDYDLTAKRLEARTSSQPFGETRDQERNDAANEPAGGSEDETETPDGAGADGASDDAAPEPAGNTPAPARAECLLAPVALCDERIIVAATTQVEGDSLLFVLSLDRTGGVEWQTYLGTATSPDYLGLGSVSSPAHCDGAAVYVLSNEGLLARVDAADGTIRWLLEYPTLIPSALEDAIRTTNRWRASPVVDAGNRIVVAPQDSSRLLGVNKESGEIAWSSRRERSAVLAGLTSDAVILAGRTVSAVTYRGPAPGSRLWSFDANAHGFSPLGRPAVAPTGILLPGRRDLLVLSPADGRIASRSAWDVGGGGNLFLSGERLAVVTPESLFIYDDRRSADVRMTRLAGKEPEVILRRAKHRLRNYELDAGLTELATWLAGPRPAPLANSGLDRLQVELAELLEEYSRAPELAGGTFRDRSTVSLFLEYRYQLESAPERKLRAAIELAAHYEKTGFPGKALASYHAALQHGAWTRKYTPPEAPPVGAAAYVRQRLRALRAANDPGVFAATEAAAEEALAQARKTNNPISSRGVTRNYPFTLAGAKAFLDASLGYRDRRSYDQAISALEDYLVDYEADPRIDRGEIVRVHLTLVNLLSLSGHRRDAKDRALRLIESHGDDVVDGVHGMVQGETVRQYLEPRLQDPGLVALPPLEPESLKPPLRMAWRSRADLGALSRRFIFPGGRVPSELEGTFLTQSSDTVECREAATGLARWRVELENIPGFELSRSSFIARIPRSGPRALRGAFEGKLLVLYDEHNLFAIDVSAPTVRWNVPFGGKSTAPTAGVPFLSERLRAVEINASGVFALSAKSGVRTEVALYHFNLRGETLWKKVLDYVPAPLVPFHFAHNRLFVHQKGGGIRVHDALGGDALRLIPGEALARSAPVEVPGDRVLLATAHELKLFDLGTESALWTIPVARGSSVAALSYSDEAPAECVVLFARRGASSPVLAGVTLGSGGIQWQLENLPPKFTRISVFRERNRLYIVYGDYQWHLLALEIRDTGARRRSVAHSAWPKPIKLGTFYSGTAARRLFIASDALVFHDPNNSVNLFDKIQGIGRPADAESINSFLAEKESPASTLLGGRYIVLTNGGDCAFESAPPRDVDAEHFTEIDLVERWLEQPGDPGRLVALAQAYFQKGKVESAIDLLDQSLLSDASMASQPQGQQLRIRHLLDGYKEEYTERRFKRFGDAPRLSCQRLTVRPTIDGELSDVWDIGSRVHLATPRHVGTIPGSGSAQHWDGEDDLSATLYTGWDEENFYFALEVTDDALYPYDREAENWVGDCLLIGIDPTGNRGFFGEDDQLMTLALTLPKRRGKDGEQDGDQGGDGDGEDEGEDGGEGRSKPRGEFAVKRRGDNSGAVYEVALPWSSFGNNAQAPPFRGFSFGLSLLLTDDDTGQGAAKTLSINTCQLLPQQQKSSLVWQFLLPNFFPRVRLE